MKVSIKYHDTTSFGPDEIKANLKGLLGESISLEVLPDSTDPHSLIYFAIQEMITMSQIDAYFHAGPLYPERKKELKAQAMEFFSEVFDLVIQDNEDKLE